MALASLHSLIIHPPEADDGLGGFFEPVEPLTESGAEIKGILALAWTITAASYVVARLMFDGLIGLVTAVIVGSAALTLWVALPRLASRSREG